MSRANTSVTAERSGPPVSPVLTRALLERIHELNCDYLELLAAEQTEPAVAAQSPCFPPAVARGLSQLSPSARRALAKAPYTLFSVGLEDRRFWSDAARADAAPIEQRYRAASARPLQSSFCEAALLHAWHVASVSMLAARLTYAMHETTAAHLISLPLWRLRRIASDHPLLLAPRWPMNAAFWPELVRLSAASDGGRLQAALLLGCQLIAAELEWETLSARQRAQQALRPLRLRARRIRFAARSPDPG